MKTVMILIWIVVGLCSMTGFICSLFDFSIERKITAISFGIFLLAVFTLAAFREDD